MMNSLSIKKEISHVWDLLAERFNTHKDTTVIHPDAAVNIEVGWPILFKEIADHAKHLGKNKLNIFDFGCGAGSFCKELNKLGHTVVGLDNSQAMLTVARENVPSQVTLLHGNHLSDIYSKPEYYEKFDVVTSIHSLEWIEDLHTAFTNLSKLLSKEGIILFAVFPKDHVADSLKIKDLFEDFDSEENPSVGYANFNGIKVPVYIRDSKFFDDEFTSLGFEKLLEIHPEYPSDFFEKYNWTGSKYPEMAIFAYRKV